MGLATQEALAHHVRMHRDVPIGSPVAISLPRPRPPRAHMAGRWCRLVPTERSHAAGLFDAFAEDRDGYDWTYLPYGPFPSPAALEDWLVSACLGDDPLFHTILSREGRALGLASYLRISAAHGTIEIGHLHHAPALQSTAAATEAMALMMARAFDELGYRRLEWKCDALNAGSRRAALRLGFVYEGTFGQAAVVKGRNRDTAWFALLDRDWPERRAAFADWFAGLDSAGRQSRPLARRDAFSRPRSVSPVSSMTEREKMVAGELYRPGDRELVAARQRAQRLLRDYSATVYGDEGRGDILRDLFGGLGEGCAVRSPIYLDYGFNVFLGRGVFINNAVMLADICPIRIGDNTQIGAMAQILAADHPRDPQIRDAGLENGKPVTIGRNCWIGAAALILPGVTVGDDAIVGAGAVVTRDVAPGTTVVGSPARPIGG